MSNDTDSGDGTPRRSRSRVAVAVALASVSGALIFTASSLPRAEAVLLAPNAPVNEGAGDLLDIAAHNSPTLVRDPTNGRNFAVVDRIDSPRFSCALHVSTDAAASWRQLPIPFPEGEELPERCYAPDVAYGADGTLHLSFVTLKGRGNVPNALWHTYSRDSGRTFSTPVRVTGPLAFQARLSADRRDGGRLYLSWLQASATGTLLFPNTGNPIVVARSDDGGATWSQPVRASPTSRARVVAPSTAIGRDGRVYLLYLDLGEDVLDYHGGHEGRGGEPYQGRWSLVLARSDDGGWTWTEAVVERAVVPHQRFVVFLAPSPSLAVSDEGRVYVGFHDGRLGDADVWLWASDDGMRFGRPVRVNDSPRHDGTSQYLPRVAVAPDGRVDVVYYDRRADRSDVMNEVSLQSSADRGRSFGARIRLSDRPFDSRVGFGLERGMPDLGSRLALISTDERALAVWTDTRAGTLVSKKQDLARAVVAFSTGSPFAGPLRAAGFGIAGLAVLALASSGLRRPLPGVGRRRGRVPMRQTQRSSESA